MTEDDTFRVLSRPSVDELSRLFDIWIGDRYSRGILTNTKQVDKFIESHGWTYREAMVLLKNREEV